MGGCASSPVAPSSERTPGGTGDGDGSAAIQPQRVQIAAALYPFEFLARRVGGPDARVISLARPGVEPHDIELDAGQVREIARAKLVIYLGGGFQPAVERATSAKSGKRSALLDVHNLAAADRPGDPHVWLDPIRMSKITLGLGVRLSRIDPKRSQSYESRASVLTKQLEDLDRQFGGVLANCDRRTIVVSHSAFGYLAARYRLKQIAIDGLSPESEPSARRLVGIGRKVRGLGITTIFFERLVSPKLARTLAETTGTRAKLLDPVESQPAHGDYLTAMEGNLRALAGALGCRVGGAS